MSIYKLIQTFGLIQTISLRIFTRKLNRNLKAQTLNTT